MRTDFASQGSGHSGGIAGFSLNRIRKSRAPRLRHPVKASETHRDHWDVTALMRAATAPTRGSALIAEPAGLTL